MRDIFLKINLRYCDVIGFVLNVAYTGNHLEETKPREINAENAGVRNSAH